MAGSTPLCQFYGQPPPHARRPGPVRRYRPHPSYAHGFCGDLGAGAPPVVKRAPTGDVDTRLGEHAAAPVSAKRTARRGVFPARVAVGEIPSARVTVAECGAQRDQPSHAKGLPHGSTTAAVWQPLGRLITQRAGGER
ncbi:hypothetical protein MBOT_29780 [Mycobacterium botniense]|uniref:Uncharacterized protein n=1 Tax=Mycobacterium botniense TaxID=84962 RepID=A0A7I9Y0Y8_9MYCO|nr:hypothetical protein MBOT_29780 [Mycobacterium botniense]